MATEVDTDMLCNMLLMKCLMLLPSCSTAAHHGSAALGSVVLHLHLCLLHLGAARTKHTTRNAPVNGAWTTWKLQPLM